MANYDRHDVVTLSVAAEDASNIPGERSIRPPNFIRQQADPPAVSTSTGDAAKWNTGFEGT